MIYRIEVELQRSDMKQDRFHCLQDTSDNHESDARQKPPAICFPSYCRQDQPDDHQQIACAVNDKYRKRILQKKGNDHHENNKGGNGRRNAPFENFVMHTGIELHGRRRHHAHYEHCC